MSKEAMKLALEALEAATRYGAGGFEDAKDALREALAEQPAQRSMKVEGPLHVVCQCDKCKEQTKPVAWGVFDTQNLHDMFFTSAEAHEMTRLKGDGSTVAPLYTSPPAQQEPVTWGVDWGKAGDIPCVSIIKRLPGGGIEVVAVEYAPYEYNPPAQRTWVGLTPEEKKNIFLKWYGKHWAYTKQVQAVMDSAEAKLKEKNT